MEQNTTEALVIPEIPKVVPKQSIETYVPTAFYDVPGIAKYDSASFVIKDGTVALRRNFLRTIIDFSIDTSTGIGTIYYDDGTKITVNFPVHKEGAISEALVTEITFLSQGGGEFSWVYADGQYVLYVDISKLNILDTCIICVEELLQDGRYSTSPTSVIKSNGQVLLVASEPFDGRMLILNSYINVASTLADYDIEVDDKLSSESTNPVQNKVIVEELDKIKYRISEGVTGAKIEYTEHVGQDDYGGNVYRQHFDDFRTFDFTAPRGPQGPKGDTGDTGPAGSGVEILGKYNSLEELKQSHPTGNKGDAYFGGEDLYVWDILNLSWINVGNIKGPQGNPGPKGDIGPKGDTGPKGDPGPQGNGIQSIDPAPDSDILYYVVLDSGEKYSITIPRGKDGASINIKGLLLESADDLPKLATVNVNDGYIVKDIESPSGYSLYFKGEIDKNGNGVIDEDDYVWVYVKGFGKGQQGERGPAGSKIVKTEPVGQTAEGNVYRQYFDNGITNEFIAPIQPGIISPIYRHIFYLCENDGTVLATVTIDINKSDEFTFDTLYEYLIDIQGRYPVSAYKNKNINENSVTPINFTIYANSSGGSSRSLHIDGYEINDYEHTGSIGNLEYPLINEVKYNLDADDVVIQYISITKIGGQDGIAIDATLTVLGAPADANAVGMAINELIYNKSTTEEYSERTTANGISIKDVSSARIAKVVGQTQFSINLFNGIPEDNDAIHKVTNSTFKIVKPHIQHLDDILLDGFGKIYTLCIKVQEKMSLETETELFNFTGRFYNAKNNTLLNRLVFDFSQKSFGWLVQTYQSENTIEKLLFESDVICNNIDTLDSESYVKIQVMLLEGEYTEDTLPDFVDYYEKHAYFKKFTSTSADGTQISTIEFENDVELPQGATIDFDNGKIIRETADGIREERINISGKYIAYKGGIEKIDSDVKDSLPCTLKQFYIASDIEANPTEEATEELKKLKVGETTYSIPQGGGSSGGISQDELDKKVDKIPGEDIIILYGRNAIGENIGYTVASSDTALQAQRIPYYRSTESTGKYTTTGGEYTIAVGTPKQPYAAANKKYVDESIHKYRLTFRDITQQQYEEEVVYREIVVIVYSNRKPEDMTLSNLQQANDGRGYQLAGTPGLFNNMDDVTEGYPIGTNIPITITSDGLSQIGFTTYGDDGQYYDYSITPLSMEVQELVM